MCKDGHQPDDTALPLGGESDEFNTGNLESFRYGDVYGRFETWRLQLVCGQKNGA